MARQLEGAPRLERAGRRERVGHFCREPGAGARGLEDAVDVAIAGAPRVAQDIARARLVDGRQLVAQPVDRLAERRAPGLRSPGLLAYPAAAVGPPALDAVRAAPRGPLGDLDLEGRWMPLAEGGRAGERDPRLAAERAQREGQRHLAEAVVVAVGLAVAGDGQDGRRPRLLERGSQARREAGAVGEERAEGDLARQRLVAEDHVHDGVRRKHAAVEAPRVERLGRDRPPGLRPGAERPDAARLVRGEHGEADAGLGERGQAGPIDRHLRQPHALGRTAEAVLEVAPAPDHLGAHVARRREGQDRVPPGLRPGVAVARARTALGVGAADRRHHLRRPGSEPGEQRRAEVEARPRVGVHHRAESTGGIEDARRHVRRVALGRDARVPVAVGRRRRLRLHHPEPRVLARGLVEVAVQGEDAHALAARSPGAAGRRAHRAARRRCPRDRGAPRGPRCPRCPARGARAPAPCCSDPPRRA